MLPFRWFFETETKSNQKARKSLENNQKQNYYYNSNLISVIIALRLWNVWLIYELISFHFHVGKKYLDFFLHRFLFYFLCPFSWMNWMISKVGHPPNREIREALLWTTHKGKLCSIKSWALIVHVKLENKKPKEQVLETF